MNDVEKSYVAAFYEAEGCCSIRTDKRTQRRYAQIRIGQKDPEILKWMHRVLGFGHIYSPAKDHITHTLVIYKLDEVRRFTKVIYPFMRSTARKEKLKEAYELSRR